MKFSMTGHEKDDLLIRAKKRLIEVTHMGRFDCS